MFRHDSGRGLARSSRLRRLHAEAWLRRWQEGRIDVAGNLPLARAIYGSYYYLLINIPWEQDPDWPFVGLSPCGLAWGGRSPNDVSGIINKYDLQIVDLLLFILSYYYSFTYFVNFSLLIKNC